ncbi:hypothetical protein [Buchananella hordeovulneris]|uniref:Uncharacterized protein n=1 Tax=Buchananella hordeovulneris TaxID=52770 RepID=A0A1Q5PZ76_9ACTO|nr:hypothetical protein [Buchananella hordeovulneris]OKL52745.1 hypothetical protein BSZ40_01165 [Buchananella hordeovulneris]RRD43840.1 hypothetical protein EII13_06095 [Buchananella hordeovulneris]RRD52002.1 hypothetical protein EII12_06340 [Buchananella hordeovulneris]
MNWRPRRADEAVPRRVSRAGSGARLAAVGLALGWLAACADSAPTALPTDTRVVVDQETAAHLLAQLRYDNDLFGAAADPDGNFAGPFIDPYDGVVYLGLEADSQLLAYAAERAVAQEVGPGMGVVFVSRFTADTYRELAGDLPGLLPGELGDVAFWYDGKSDKINLDATSAQLGSALEVLDRERVQVGR